MALTLLVLTIGFGAALLGTAWALRRSVAPSLPAMTLLVGGYAAMLWWALVLAVRVVEREASLRVLRQMAFSDPLTGLANRRELRRMLDDPAAGTARRVSDHTVLIIDLDGFKRVNDACGHHIGDTVLIEVARRLRANLRAVDLPARLGGDEFAVVLAAAHDEAVRVAERLRGALTEPYPIPGGQVKISASIGIAGSAEDCDLHGLLRGADMALRLAKQRGKNRVEILTYGPDGAGVVSSSMDLLPSGAATDAA